MSSSKILNKRKDFIKAYIFSYICTFILTLFRKIIVLYYNYLIGKPTNQQVSDIIPFTTSNYLEAFLSAIALPVLSVFSGIREPEYFIWIVLYTLIIYSIYQVQINFRKVGVFYTSVILLVWNLIQCYIVFYLISSMP